MKGIGGSRACPGQSFQIRQLAVWPVFISVPVLLYLNGQILPLPNPAFSAAWLLPLMVLLNLSLGPIGLSAGHCHSQTVMTKAARVRSVLPAVLFWLAASLLLLLIRGYAAAWPVLPAALLFFWAERCGTAFCHAGGSRWAASLFQATCYSGLVVPFALAVS